MPYTIIHNPQAPPLHRWAIAQNERYAKHLLELPTGDYISPRLIDMVRCTATKADRSTGEVGAAVHIECKGSWFTIKFDEVDEARGFARTLATFRDELNDR